jgi:hypothetical protein
MEVQFSHFGDNTSFSYNLKFFQMQMAVKSKYYRSEAGQRITRQSVAGWSKKNQNISCMVEFD